MNPVPYRPSLFCQMFLVLVSLLLASCGGEVKEIESTKIKTYRYYLTGDPELPVNVADPSEPSLVLMGGDTDVDEAFRWMIQRAGIRPGSGGRFVIIRASGEDGYNEYLYYSNEDLETSAAAPAGGWVGGAALGLSSVESIVIPDRASANDPAVIAAVARAQVVFIAGGDQSNYIKYWKGSALHRTLDQLMARNVPIGGTSAGLAILGQFDFSALYDGITSQEAMADPFDRNLTLDPFDPADPAKLQLVTTGGLITPMALKNVITDAHVGPRPADGDDEAPDGRGRMGRFMTFMARLTAPLPNGTGGCPGGVLSYDKVRGVAVAPRTALVVSGDGVRAPFKGKALTNPDNTYESAVYFASASSAPTVCASGTPLTFRGVNIQKVKALQAGGGEVFNLSTWQREGGSDYTLDIEAGGLMKNGQPISPDTADAY